MGDARGLYDLVHTIFSPRSTLLLAAVISLLVVILFVLLLHAYAKCFLPPPTHRTLQLSPPTSTAADPVPDAAVGSGPGVLLSSKGLDPSTVASIPLFSYDPKQKLQQGLLLECVICLGAFEAGEVGRALPACGHAFHVECIDAWFRSGSTCPVCRSHPVEAATGEMTAAAAAAAEESDASAAGRPSERIIDQRQDGDEELSSSDETGLVDGECLQVVIVDYQSKMVAHDNEIKAVSKDIQSESVSPSSSSSSSSSSALGCSLTRMLSRNRSIRKNGFPLNLV